MLQQRVPYAISTSMKETIPMGSQIDSSRVYRQNPSMTMEYIYFANKALWPTENPKLVNQESYQTYLAITVVDCSWLLQPASENVNFILKFTTSSRNPLIIKMSGSCLTVMLIRLICRQKRIKTCNFHTIKIMVKLIQMENYTFHHSPNTIRLVIHSCLAR